LRNFIDNTVKPQSIWDATKYLNIWVTDKSDALNSKGFATPPPLSGLSGIPVSATTSLNDGVWCYGKSVGSYLTYPAGIYVDTDVSGRLLTHEIGHWLGLRHIWGDGNCFSDYCNDTPSHANPNAGNPTYPQSAGSCSSPSNAPDGEMFMNFMDYTANASMYMFTTDQVTRMQTAMANSPQRNQHGTHGICSSLTVSENSFSNKIKIYPNPTTDFVMIEDKDNQINFIEIYTVLGQTITKTSEKNISFEQSSKGIYWLKVYFKNDEIQFFKIVKN
jgi:Pregnancy-associated plasma protein-A/Secretion system C-terminal sorting domain